MLHLQTLLKWLLLVKDGCSDHPYHNWRHAFNVAQTVFALISVSVCVCVCASVLYQQQICTLVHNNLI